MEAYRRNALIAAFGELPDKELQRLGRGLEAHHANCMKSGQVVLVPVEIHELIHTLTRLGDNAQVLIECAQMLLAQFTIK